MPTGPTVRTTTEEDRGDVMELVRDSTLPPTCANGMMTPSRTVAQARGWLRR